MSMGPLERGYLGLSKNMDILILENFANIANKITPIVSLLLVVAIIWNGYKLIASPRGVEETSKEIILNIVKYGLIMAFFSDPSLYKNYVVDVFQKTPDDFSNVFKFQGSSIESQTLIGRVDDYFSNAMSVGKDMLSWTNIGQSLLGIVFMLSAVLAGVFSVLQIGIADLGMAIFLMLGPIAMAASFFSPTRGLFEGWLRGLITFAITKIMLLLILSVVLFTFENAANEFKGNFFNRETFSYYIAYLIYTVLMLFILMRIPDFASQLGGGISASASRLAYDAADKVKSAAGITSRAGGRGAVGAVTGAKAASGAGGVKGAAQAAGGAVVGAAAGIAASEIRKGRSVSWSAQTALDRMKMSARRSEKYKK